MGGKRIIQPDGKLLITSGRAAIQSQGGSCCPRGVCCLPDCSCVPNVTRERCEHELHGRYYPGVRSCDEADCGSLGICCKPDGTCAEAVTAEQCAELGGTYHPCLAYCGERRACCVPGSWGPECVMTTVECCRQTPGAQPRPYWESCPGHSCSECGCIPGPLPPRFALHWSGAREEDCVQTPSFWDIYSQEYVSSSQSRRCLGLNGTHIAYLEGIDGECDACYYCTDGALMEYYWRNRCSAGSPPPTPPCYDIMTEPPACTQGLYPMYACYHCVGLCVRVSGGVYGRTTIRVFACNTGNSPRCRVAGCSQFRCPHFDATVTVEGLCPHDLPPFVDDSEELYPRPTIGFGTIIVTPLW